MTTSTSARPFTGWHMLASLVAFFGVIIAVNLTLAYLANATWSGLVVRNGYVASQSFGKDLERARAQDALGWNVAMSHTTDRLRLTFSDRDQQKITALSITGKLRRPASERYDQSVSFSEATPGVYATPATLAPGLWELEIEANGKDMPSFIKTYRFTVGG